MEKRMNKDQYDRIVNNIKQTLDNYVAPAVAGHGGIVNFVDFQDGTLTLETRNHIPLGTRLSL